MKQYRDYDRNENVDERLIVTQCVAVTAQDVMTHLDYGLIAKYLDDMREQTLDNECQFMRSSAEWARCVLDNAVWAAAAHKAAMIQFGDADNLEGCDE